MDKKRGIKRKVEKGILGVPKRQTLFYFNVREGEEWSSDSEDSDYVPSDEEKILKQKVEKDRKAVKKIKCDVSTKQLNSESKRLLTNDKTSTKNSRVGLMDLPEEILLKIFQEIVSTSGPLPFLVRASKVCCQWRDVASDPSLWTKIDLSYGWIKSNDVTLKKLCESHLKQCVDINLANWSSLTATSVKLLAESCQYLSAVNFSHCKKINTEAIITLAENCNKLSSLDLSFTPLDAVSLQSLKILLPKHGAYLKQFNIGGNNYKSFISIFNLILTHCPGLELFDLSNCIFSTDLVAINVKKFQEACPNLQILGLANSRIVGNPLTAGNRQANLGSFLKLEQLSVAYNKKDIQPKSCLGLDFVTRILHKCENLKLLDIRGNSNLDCYDGK